LERGLRRPADSLAAIAEAAYEAGEIGMTELIDAHRSELALRRESIERALDARKAYVEWQLLTGDE
jgi:outer membrane protein, heavy metal efflux system